ncbi:hypothetical protein [Streptomyces sp. NPDC001020]
MTEPHTRTTAIAREDYSGTAPGPDSDPARVFEVYENEGHADPGAAWASFTTNWNWAASLPHAVAESGPDGPPTARAVPGGFSLSGRWRLPGDTEVGRWLALPLAGPRGADREDAAAIRPDLPDVFVIASKVLSRPNGGLHTVRFPADSDTACRLDGVHVPPGFATHSSGAALSARDIGFLWTAVAGMAVGAASRLADELAVLGPSVAAPFLSPATTAAELSALLRQERLGFTTELYARPGQLIPLTAREPLADRVRRTARLVHHVVTAAYERAIPFPTKGGHHPLESLVVDSAAVLQHLRFTVDLLLIQDVGSPTGR